MIEVYSSAHNVCIWIGEDDASKEKSDLLVSTAMDFVPSIVNLTVLERIVSGQESNEQTARSCSAFAKLLKKSWFGRRWVIQEVAAAHKASVHYGRHCINWINFADAVDLFASNIDDIRSMYSKSDTAKDDPDALRHVESVGARAIISTTNNVLRKARDGTVVDRPLDIESLAMEFLHCDATDPRDTIYALIALASDGQFSSSPPNTPSLRPDYTKSSVVVYMEFVQHCIVARGSLDIICRNWALPIRELPFRWTRENTSGLLGQSRNRVGRKMLPSWIGLVSNSAFGPPSRFTGRFNGDGLVGSPGRSIYNASSGRRMDVQFDDQDIYSAPGLSNPEPSRALHISGMVIGQVSRVTSRVVDGTISDDCLEMLGWYQDDDVNKIPDRLWRTLVANRDSNGQTPPLWYRRACMYCLKKTTAEGDLNTGKLLEMRSLPETVLQFLRRVQAVVWSRKFFVGLDLRDKSSEIFGLGPRYAKEGDLMCILYGCSVPVLLRPLDSWSQYGLVGECYIHEKMDGEAIMGLSERSVRQFTTSFDLI